MGAAPVSFTMHVAGRTDVGLIREHNEDNLTVVDLDSRTAQPLDGMSALPVRRAGALIIVCDGMGGAAAGEVASAMAIEEVSRSLIERSAQPPSSPPSAPSPSSPAAAERAADLRRAEFARWLREAAWDANQRIFAASRADDSRAGMGTTMTTVGVVGTDLVMAQVGDSRAYLLRDGRLVQVTRDQSLVNQLIETGQISEEQARMFEHSNVILQALGVQEEVEVLLSTVPLRRGDRLVVCTDGLTGVVSDEEVAAVLGSSDDMDQVCRALIDLARGGGGPDNITVVAARFDDEALPRPHAGERVLYERWRLDDVDQPRIEERVALPDWPASAVVRPRSRIDPARTFFSMMLLLALALGGLVTALQMRRAGGTACTVQGAPGLTIRVDGRDVGVRTLEGEAGVALRLPPGRHRVALRQPSGRDQVRTVEVARSADCRITFEEDR